MDNFIEQNIKDFICNPFTKIGNEWMLITAGNKQNFNTMTASWGTLGIMWGKNVAISFIRPQRYTKEFVDSNDTYSLCFFPEEYKKDLSYLGTVSGRNENKIEKCNLTPIFLDNTPCFEESNLVFICKKLYHQDIKPECFIDNSLDQKWYESKDYHTMYFSEILKIYTKKDM